MNLKPLLLGSLFLPLTGQAQTPSVITSVNRLGQTVTVATATRFMKTPPMSEWPVVADDDTREHDRHEVDKHRPLPEVTAPQFENEPDGALQRSPARRVLKAPIVSVNGQYGTGVPPDPTGAIGTDRYVQAVNTSFRAYLKSNGQTSGPSHSLRDRKSVV